MLIGYVSDERYVAMSGVHVELLAQGRSWATQSRASGAVWIDELPAGDYEAVLAYPGYGSKRVQLKIAEGQPPHQFRLLKDALLGYAWPK